MYKDLAVHDLRKYIWNELVSKQVLDPNDYRADGFTSTLIPIIPSQQVPEFVNLLPGRTHIVYNYQILPTPIQWWMTEETAIFAIFSQDYDKINEIINVLQDLFRRYDESAAEVNAYLAGNSRFIFRNTQVDSVDSPIPFKTEGAMQQGEVSIFYVYSVKTDEKGRF